MFASWPETDLKRRNMPSSMKTHKVTMMVVLTRTVSTQSTRLATKIWMVTAMVNSTTDSCEEATPANDNTVIANTIPIIRKQGCLTSQ